MNRYPNTGLIFTKPETATELIRDIQQRGRIAVPSKNGTILDLWVVSIEVQESSNNKQTIAYISAQETIYKPARQFALVVGGEPKRESIPTLWMESINSEHQWLSHTAPIELSD